MSIISDTGKARLRELKVDSESVLEYFYPTLSWTRSELGQKSKQLTAVKLIDKKSESFTMQSIRLFCGIPKKMRQTLTVDNGSEFSRFKELENETGLTVYFADPYAACQRGTNENTNGLLRQYFPKGTDFSKITEEDLAFAGALAT